MSCERYLDWISARLDGELTAQEETQLADHLCQCEQCRVIAEELECVRGALTELEQVQPPKELSGRVMDQIRQEKQRQKETARRRTFRQLAGLAACLLLFVGVYRMDRAGMDRGQNVFDVGYTAARFVAGEQAYTAYSAQADSAHADVEQVTEHTQTSAGEPAHYFFCNDRYIRLYSPVEQVPAARILGSVQELLEFAAGFAEDDLSEVIGKYDETYFKQGRLLAVVLEENSGSIRHKIDSQGLLCNKVVIQRIVPEQGTCDMAAWLILAEVDTMFEGGRELRVEFGN